MSPTSYQTAPPRGGEPRLHLRGGLGRRGRAWGRGGGGLGGVGGLLDEGLGVVGGFLVAGQVACLQRVVGVGEAGGGRAQKVGDAGDRGPGRRRLAATRRRGLAGGGGGLAGALLFQRGR